MAQVTQRRKNKRLLEGRVLAQPVSTERIGWESYGTPKPFPSVPLPWEQTGVLQQIQAKAQGWVADSPSVRPPADGSQPSSTGVPAHSQACLHPIPSLTACSFPRILLALDKSHLSSGLLARF